MNEEFVFIQPLGIAEARTIMKDKKNEQKMARPRPLHIARE